MNNEDELCGVVIGDRRSTLSVYLLPISELFASIAKSLNAKNIRVATVEDITEQNRMNIGNQNSLTRSEFLPKSTVETDQDMITPL